VPDAELRPAAGAPASRRQRQRLRLAVEGDRLVAAGVAGAPVTLPVGDIARVVAVAHPVETSSYARDGLDVLVLDSHGHRLATLPNVHAVFSAAEIRDFCRRAGLGYGTERQPSERAARHRYPQAAKHHTVRTMAGGRTLALTVGGLLLAVIVISLIVSLLR
jgi:hypothetical protein